ncbi:MAG: hypothetical protein ACI84K_001399 [Pseudohongiellaceae bacterium]|jgi:hypothetical protein
MRSVKTMALVTAIAAATSVQAEMVALDDALLSEATGQAGLTIDINDLEISIGAMDYKDQGFLSMKNFRFGVADETSGDKFDNIRMTLDIAGPGGIDNADLGEDKLGAHYIEQAAFLVDGDSGTGYVDQAPLITDGDLVISFRTMDLTNIFNAVDFGLDIGSIGLGASTEAIGEVNDGTVLLANLELDGFLGPVDIIIDGNDSGMNISGYFNATGHVDQPFRAVQTDFYIHNSRGLNTVWLNTKDRSNSMAHMQINISKQHDYLATGQTAMKFDLQNFSADLDFENVTLGTFAGADGRGIGDIYFTDLTIRAETLVYGH